MTACGAIGALMVGGRVVGQLRCDREAGHEVDRQRREYGVLIVSEATPHRAILEWTPEHEVDLDLFDPDERFDVEIPA